MTSEQNIDTRSRASVSAGPGRRSPFLLRALELAASGKVALVLIAVVSLLSVAGAMIPQEFRFAPGDIAVWKVEHSLFSALGEPLGLFHVFSSWTFLVAIALLGINTLASIVRRFLKQGGWSAMKGPRSLERVGFHLLHVSVLLLLLGGFWTAAADLDGKILLTEGQTFTDAPDQYLSLQKGALRTQPHSGVSVRLIDFDVRFADSRRPIAAASTLELLSEGEKVGDGSVEVNRPIKYGGLSFTYDSYGFSPRLIARAATGRRALIDTFVALQTAGNQDGNVSRDLIPFPFFKDRVIATLYPSFEQHGDAIRRTGDTISNPLLVLTVESSGGTATQEQRIALGDRAHLAGFEIEFADLRHWVSFRVSHDPGYPLVCVAFVLGLLALMLRYSDDLRTWVKELIGVAEVDGPVVPDPKVEPVESSADDRDTARIAAL